jgi:hypothetical protein
MNCVSFIISWKPNLAKQAHIKNLSLNDRGEPSDKEAGGEYETKICRGTNRRVLGKGGALAASPGARSG